MSNLFNLYKTWHIAVLNAYLPTYSTSLFLMFVFTLFRNGSGGWPGRPEPPIVKVWPPHIESQCNSCSSSSQHYMLHVYMFQLLLMTATPMKMVWLQHWLWYIWRRQPKALCFSSIPLFILSWATHLLPIDSYLTDRTLTPPPVPV